MALGINIKPDLKGLQRAFVDLHAKQAPFAISLALNALAKGVVASERDAVDRTFNSPTRFTENAFRIETATKSKPLALIAVKDIQAAYLAPYVVGGDRSLGTKKGMLAPRNVALNQYGNLTKGKLQQLLAKPNVFVGRITFKKTGATVSGVWQRGVGKGNGPSIKAGQRRSGGYRTKGNNQNVVGGVRTTLKLLIQFEDTTPVPKHLPFVETAKAYVARNASREMGIAIQKAMATARR